VTEINLIPKSNNVFMKVHELEITAQTIKSSTKYVHGQESRPNTVLRKTYEKTRKKYIIIDEERNETFNLHGIQPWLFSRSADHEVLVHDQNYKNAAIYLTKRVVYGKGLA
jgi:hypothetical protein